MVTWEEKGGEGRSAGTNGGRDGSWSVWGREVPGEGRRGTEEIKNGKETKDSGILSVTGHGDRDGRPTRGRTRVPGVGKGTWGVRETPPGTEGVEETGRFC